MSGITWIQAVGPEDNMKIKIDCPMCEGDGMKRLKNVNLFSYDDCPKCDGKGWVMVRQMKVQRGTRKWWVLSRGSLYLSRSQILAVCKTKKEAEKLLDQNPHFRGASIDNAPEYMNMY